MVCLAILIANIKISFSVRYLKILILIVYFNMLSQITIQTDVTPQLEDLLALRAFSNNPWEIHANIFGTLGSAGELGLEFSALCKVIFGVAQTFQHTGKFYDFGFGDGLVLFLAATAGFESHGHECRSEGFEAAKKSLDSDLLEGVAPKIHAKLGDCLTQPVEFYQGIDVWYLYPACGVTKEVISLFAQHASPDSLLVMKGNSELRLNLHTVFPNKGLWIEGEHAFCFVSKSSDLLNRAVQLLSNE